jgi:hypothetical protein
VADPNFDGHWFVTFQPLPVVSDRIPLNELQERVVRSRVSLRGWDYPHLANDLEFLDGGIESTTDRGQYQERWRVKTSGFFAHRWRMREDGIRDRVGTLDFVNAIWSMTEVFIFASRLYGGDQTVDAVTITLELDGLHNRRLTGSSEYWITVRHLPQANSFKREATLQRASLAAEPEATPALWAQALFHMMGAPGFTLDTIGSHQQRLVLRKSG